MHLALSWQAPRDLVLINIPALPAEAKTKMAKRRACGPIALIYSLMPCLVQNTSGERCPDLGFGFIHVFLVEKGE